MQPNSFYKQYCIWNYFLSQNISHLSLGSLAPVIKFTFKYILDFSENFEMASIGLSDSYPAFFLLIATTSNKNFLKVQKL